MRGNTAELLDEVNIPESSALEGLQFLYTGQKHLLPEQIFNAVESDVDRRVRISEVFFKRFVSSNREIDSACLERVLAKLRSGLNSPDLRDPDIFSSYARAAVMCMRSLKGLPQ